MGNTNISHDVQGRTVYIIIDEDIKSLPIPPLKLLPREGARPGFGIMLGCKGHFFGAECPNKGLIFTVKCPSLGLVFKGVP